MKTSTRSRDALLRDIVLLIDGEEFTPELSSMFQFQTRYLCNFLERQLRKQRARATGLSRIRVQGTLEPGDGCPIQDRGTAVAEVKFDESRYRRLRPEDLHEFLFAMLREGLEKCAQHHRIPLTTMLALLEEFRAGGYRNEWEHQSKTLRTAGIRATLACGMNPERFVLRFIIERSKHVVFSKELLRTKPDEVIFVHRFRDLVLTGESASVTNKRGETIFSVPLANLGKREAAEPPTKVR